MSSKNVACDSAIQAARRVPMRRRNEAKKPKYVVGPVLVRQVLVDPESGALLTEEGDSELCRKKRLDWESWRSCVDASLPYGWVKKTRFLLRWRSVKHLRTLGKLARLGKPFRRLLHFRKGRVVEVGGARTAMVVHDLKEPKRRSVQREGMQRWEKVQAAEILPDGRVLVVSVSGKRKPDARLRWWNVGDKHLRKPVLTFRYAKKRFLGHYRPRMGMFFRYHHVYCSSGDKLACDKIKQYGGIPYERCVERDRAVALAASRDGEKLALYIFGTLYLYRIHDDGLSLVRRWVDIFYVDKDHFIERPGLTWDAQGRWVALTSSKRLNLIVDTKKGRVIQLRDRAIPKSYASYYKLAIRGAAFVPGSSPALMYGDLRSDLVRYDLRTGRKRQWQLPEAKGYSYDYEYSDPDLISYLQFAGDNMVAWRGGAVYVLDRRTMKLRGRVGTYAGLGWSRRLSNLEIP